MKSRATAPSGSGSFSGEGVVDLNASGALQRLRRRYQTDIFARDAFDGRGVQRGAVVPDADTERAPVEPVIDAIQSASQTLKKLIKVNELTRADAEAANVAMQSQLANERHAAQNLRTELDNMRQELARVAAEKATSEQDYEEAMLFLRERLEKTERDLRISTELLSVFSEKINAELAEALLLAEDIISTAHSR